MLTVDDEIALRLLRSNPWLAEKTIENIEQRISRKHGECHWFGLCDTGTKALSRILRALLHLAIENT